MDPILEEDANRATENENIILITTTVSAINKVLVNGLTSSLSITLLLYCFSQTNDCITAVSYTHLRAHETVLDIVCRLLLEKKKKKT